MQLVHNPLVPPSEHHHEVLDSHGPVAVPGPRTGPRRILNSLPLEDGRRHCGATSVLTKIRGHTGPLSSCADCFAGFQWRLTQHRRKLPAAVRRPRMRRNWFSKASSLNFAGLGGSVCRGRLEESGGDSCLGQGRGQGDCLPDSGEKRGNCNTCNLLIP